MTITMTNNDLLHKKVSGIILAGGLSTRFQTQASPWIDKALIKIDNLKSMLLHTIEIFTELCNEIIIVSNNLDRQTIYQKEIQLLDPRIQHLIKIVLDDNQVLCSGPTLGIISGLKHVTNKFAIIAPVDMPFLQSTIFKKMLENLSSHTLLSPYWSSTGKIEPLIIALNVEKIQIHCSILSQIQRSRADDFHRGVSPCNFLAISSSREKEAEKLFTSINNRSAIQITSIKSPLPKCNNLFDFKKSFQSTKKQDEQLLIKLAKFLSEKTFLALDNLSLKTAFHLAKNLYKKGMYFYSGLLLYNLSSKFSKISQNKNPQSEMSEEISHSILTLCFHSFLNEAQYWDEHNLKLLAFHSYSDGQVIASQLTNTSQKDFINKRIQSLKEALHLKEKKHVLHTFQIDIEEKFPFVLSKAKQIIQESEHQFNQKNSQMQTNFLWDHSYRVANIAYYIAIKEGIDPVIPTFVALFHDAGKFVLGKYHIDTIPEEKYSASLAEKVFQDESTLQEQISIIENAISSIYNDDSPCDINCMIAQDADRLEKLGALGIANFYLKSALRGINLSEGILTNLSREITYALNTPKLMFTKTGRLLATTRSHFTLNYFETLLNDIRMYGLGNYFIKKYFIKETEVVLIIPEKCDVCNCQILISFSIEKDVKCEKLFAKYNCTHCDQTYQISFCLPLVKKSTQ